MRKPAIFRAIRTAGLLDSNAPGNVLANLLNTLLGILR
jgi:hypothetical protein